MKTFKELINECLQCVTEVFPWDLQEEIDQGKPPLIVDVREPYEFEVAHIKNSFNVPRGILETACEYEYEETIPELVSARDREIVVVCRSGNRSVMAAAVMQQLGFQKVRSLKTGLRGWNDAEQELIDQQGRPVDVDETEHYFTPNLRPEQLKPKT
ncbi:MAG: rhodanese-like domain-containing protein [Gammaproteobacteria bacterium]|jgi:rhodanese-related sulfurtransferase|nr:rhodanese-like domain-containing protein [Gammaproteobacteria bacterium]